MICILQFVHQGGQLPSQNEKPATARVTWQACLLLTTAIIMAFFVGMSANRVTLLGLLLSAFIAATIASDAITLQVEPQTEECFYVNNPPNTQDSYSITFTVIRGGKLDVYLQVCLYFLKILRRVRFADISLEMISFVTDHAPQVTDPNKEVLHRELYFFDASKDDFLGTYTFDARQTGVYAICFDNKMSRYFFPIFHLIINKNYIQIYCEGCELFCSLQQ
jgi:hypothetical protein